MKRARKLVYLDANIVIHMVEGHPLLRKELADLISVLESEEIEAVSSELTLAEVLVVPLRNNDLELCRVFQEFFGPRSPATLMTVDKVVLKRAAEIRAGFGGRLPDAIHLATADILGCDAFLTEDRRIWSPSGLHTVALSGLRELLTKWNIS
jgi:predicted nucleic acid-binding protein